jgi:hypothetical protein
LIDPAIGVRVHAGADLAVLQRTGAHPRRLLDMGRARLTRLIAKASSGHLGEERTRAWLDAAHLALELYGGHPALAFDDRAAEVLTEVRLLHATEAELPAHESAREQAYRQVDPGPIKQVLFSEGHEHFSSCLQPRRAAHGDCPVSCRDWGPLTPAGKKEEGAFNVTACMARFPAQTGSSPAVRGLHASATHFRPQAT